MDLGRHLQFCPPGSAFFDIPARASPEEGNFPLAYAELPEGWARQLESEWVGINPHDAELPPQGWKIHVSATLENAEEILEVTAAYLLKLGVVFKFIRSRTVLESRNGKYGDRSASGKFITVYPSDEAQLERILRELGEQLDGYEGPYILSDLRWRSGPLYVRYGGFITRTLRGPSGTLVHVIEDPAGELVPDHRGPGFRPPSWVTLPDCLNEAMEARKAGTLKDFPYKVTGAVHFSNGGGIYKGVDTRDGREILLREARPHSGLANGGDAVHRQQRERWALERLADVDCVPPLLDFRKGHEHWFLVREFVTGEPLGRLMVQRNPLALGSTDPANFAEYARWALDILDQVEHGVDALHERGVVFSDLHPSNILVRPDGRVAFIDFETSTHVEDAGHQALGAHGFIAPSEATGPAIDRYALGCLRLAVFNALTSVLPWGPRKTADLISDVTSRFPLPADFTERVHADLGVTDTDTAQGTDWFGGDAASVRAEWPERSAQLASGVLRSASPARDDRLFPGDPDQFQTAEGTTAFAFGTAGVLWSLAESGIDVPPEHVERLIEDTRRLSAPRTDFFHGLSGIAYALDRLGRVDEAAELLPLLDGQEADGLGPSLFTGSPGIGLTLLHFARRTGDRELLARAQRLAEQVIPRVTDPEAGAEGRFGLLRGSSGGALLLLRLHEETKDPALLEHALTAIRHDLVALGWAAGDGGEVGFSPDSPGRMPLLGPGCAGTGMVLHDLLTHHPDPELLQARDGIAALTARHYLPEAGVLRGRAGALLALRHFGQGEQTETDVLRHVRDFRLQAVDLPRAGPEGTVGAPHEGASARPADNTRPEDAPLAMLGQESLRISTDFATGSAGALLALSSALGDRSVSFPFFAAGTSR